MWKNKTKIQMVDNIGLLLVNPNKEGTYVLESKHLHESFACILC